MLEQIKELTAEKRTVSKIQVEIKEIVPNNPRKTTESCLNTDADGGDLRSEES
ncbi:MAG: hypothetical protein F6K50_39665 [Moorea sp. SIO3I7]|uniref:hypothetical protein n=1 Tax=Moorena TaxID=1155738 RepID=UPI00130137BC|nr:MULTISPECIES: hypothetical protein [Moorena]NEO01308.1 hypothetical protein [Moorena sp. SIO3I7]NEO60494.1 hypothetical protein [Moorena sp. SIO4G2]NEO14065.1 hypothetical protein [Moorena sp. SIO3E8]NEO72283.1 hypothetical protein [Moorena sp. SIO3H5]NEP27962.1 hypothetical protein [Moorena sp. SIO3I6]